MSCLSSGDTELDLDQSDDEEIDITVYGEDCSLPVDISAASAATFILQATLGDAPALSFTLSAGITLSDPTNGVYTVSISKADMLLLDFHHGYFFESTITLGGITNQVVAGVAYIAPALG
jgi:hypothetical protein